MAACFLQGRLQGCLGAVGDDGNLPPQGIRGEICRGRRVSVRFTAMMGDRHSLHLDRVCCEEMSVSVQEGEAEVAVQRRCWAVLIDQSLAAAHWGGGLGTNVNVAVNSTACHDGCNAGSLDLESRDFIPALFTVLARNDSAARMPVGASPRS